MYVNHGLRVPDMCYLCYFHVPTNHSRDIRVFTRLSTKCVNCDLFMRQRFVGYQFHMYVCPNKTSSYTVFTHVPFSLMSCQLSQVILRLRVTENPPFLALG